MTTKDLFSASDRERIAAAIAAAEAKTSGEIVPVVAGASGRYDRAEGVVGVITALVLLLAVWVGLAPDGAAAEAAASWEQPAGVSMSPALACVIVILGYIGGAALATRFPLLRLPFIPGAEMRAEVERSAEAAFHRFRLRETAGATGILIYVSLYEHQVRVLGDSTITAKLSAADWQHICDAVTEGMAHGREAEGLVRGIERAGELLARHFPRQADDRNELVNDLILVD